MKALVLAAAGAAENLRLADMPQPIPAPGEVLVRVHASAFNRRDLAIVSGKHPNLKLPCVLGADGAGIVEAAGDAEHAHLIGREVVLYPARAWGESERSYGPQFRVLGMPDPGTFADYVCMPAEDVYPKPAHLSWTQAAAIPLSGLTAWRAVMTQGEVKPGQKVLISGAGGGVANFALQWCVQLGAQVYVTSGSEEKIERAKAHGALGGVLYGGDDLRARIKALAGGIDLVIDGAGGPGAMALIEALRPGGRYVCYGATLGNPEGALDLRGLMLRQIRVQGTTMGSPREFAAMLDFVSQRKLEPVVDRVLPLRDGAAGLALMAGFGHTGKIVLDHST
jgi:zinc-binding alcohol dehydrogenase/oxidoreductase